MKDCIQKMEEYISDALVPINMREYFDNMLDECYSLRSVGGPFAHMQPSQVLRECDPVAYRCGVSDVYDSDAMVIIGDEYYWREEVEKQVDNYISEVLETLKYLLEDEIDELGEDEEDARQELEKLEKQIVDVNNAIAECESHSF